MFLNTPGRATKLKKIIYLTISMILGLLLSFIAHALIEMAYLTGNLNHNQLVKFYGGCALPPFIQLLLLLIGIGGGLFLGSFWWQKIYVERKWLKKKEDTKLK